MSAQSSQVPRVTYIVGNRSRPSHKPSIIQLNVYHQLLQRCLELVSTPQKIAARATTTSLYEDSRVGGIQRQQQRQLL